MANAEPDTLKRIYQSLRLVRRVEEVVAEIYPTDKIKSPVHLSIGQEAVAVGVCDALTDTDVVSGTYRGHATYLAAGGDLNAMIAEMFGKATGCAQGKGGSMHLVGMEQNILGTSAVVGTTISIAMGFALALKKEGKGRVAVSFFGDGATDEGCFYECLNFAILQNLPMLFVCENNSYAIHTSRNARWATQDLHKRVAGFGMPYAVVKDLDVLEIRKLAGEMIEQIRSGKSGPQFLECHCYRWREHVGPGEDYDAGYRSRDELQPWIDSDQMPRIGEMIDAGAREEIDKEVEEKIAQAVEFAEQSPPPTAEELFTNVYAK